MSRGNQVERQWRVLRLLEGARRGLTVAEIREALHDDTSVRTLYRDLEQLRGVGFPVFDEGGRWEARHTPGWTFPMSPSHVLALMLSENLLAPVASTPLGEPLAELRRRLSATLTPAARAYCEELKGTVVATTFAPGDLARHGHAIERIEEAIHRQHRLALRYRAPRKALEDRRVDPYCTWYHSGGLYLVAWCHKAVDIRTFNVQRIESAVVLDEAFEPDPRFDADAFTRLGFGVLHGPVHHVVIEFTDEVAHLVRERLVHHTQRIHELADGGIRFSIDAAGLPEIARWVAGFGSEARPVAPPELIDAVRHIHERGLAMCQARS